MDMELLIKLGGIYYIILIVFHLLFWRIFNWQEDLRSVSFINRSTMQVMNIFLIFVFLFFLPGYRYFIPKKYSQLH